jgi:glucose-6-phosphate isomerase
MKRDLSHFAGFKLSLDPTNLEIETADGLVLRRVSRTAGELEPVLLSPGEVAPQTELYRNYLLEEAPEDARLALARDNLDFSLVFMPPMMVGREFVKTMGHYHPLIPGTNMAFPEVYAQFFGRLLLLLQKRKPADPNRVEDCALVELTPGYVITIPPGYAHVLINASEEPALMGGLYGSQRAFKPDYAPVKEKRGLAYYVVAQDGQIAVEPNPNYADSPPLRRLADLSDTPFAPVEPGAALWQSLLARPELYAFLSRPDAATRHFNSPNNGGARA